MHLLAVVVAASFSVALAQPSVRAVDASVVLAETAKAATALVVVENGTMYDVYLTGATTEIAESIEIREKPKGAAAAAVKEVPVPAFGRLEMSSDGVHLALVNLKRPLKAGE